MGSKDTFFSNKPALVCRGELISLERPLVMGILNITPDSFYEGSRKTRVENIREEAGKMVEQGASILDIGAVSTRPGAQEISARQELERLQPALEIIRESCPAALLSVDTYRSEVARRVVQDFQVDMINDISGGEMDQDMFAAIAELQVPYVLMHMRGTPETMQQHTRYKDLIREILHYFAVKTDKLNKLGVRDIIVDPGFGFAKTIGQNYEILAKLESFHVLGYPLLVGLSRKSMIYKTLGINAEQALNGTTALHAVALLKGADILRVHDVQEAVEVIKLLDNLVVK